MRLFDEISVWVRAVVLRARVESEMEKEIRLHLDLEIESNIRRGMSPDEARRIAFVAFGGVEKTKEAIRDERGARRLELAELRQAARRLARAPMFTLSSVALLALGLGGATVVFGALDVMYLRPPPFPAANRLAFVQVQLPQSMCRQTCARDPMPDELARWRPLLAESVDAVGTISTTQISFTADDGAHQLEGAAISADVPSMLGFRASVGRTFTSDELRGHSNAIVLGHDAWVRDFGADSAIVGRLLHTESVVYRVIGVLAAQSDLGKPFFNFNRPKADFVLPPSGDDPGGSSSHTLLRLKAGVDLRAFRSRAASLPTASLAAGAPDHVIITPLRELFAKDYRTSVWLVTAAVAIMLIVVCVNFAALIAARLNARTPELTTRVALGASRWSLTRMVAIETCIIVVAGFALGVWLGREILDLARLLPPEAVPPGALPSVDMRVGALATATAILIAIGLSAVPWMVFAPAMMQRRLRDVFSQGADRRRVRNALLATQVALAVMLLAGAGLLTRLFIDAESRGTGTSPHSVLYVFLSSVPDVAGDAAARSFAARLHERFARLPGVTGVAFSGSHRTSGAGGGGARRIRGRDAIAITIEGRADGVPVSAAPRRGGDVSPDYPLMLGLRLLAGRWFTTRDAPSDPPVAMLDSVAAVRLFPAGTPVGHRIRFGDASSTEPWLTIVGVSSSLHHALPTDSPDAGQVYQSSQQFPSLPGTIVVRTNTTGEYDVVPGLRRALADIDQSVTISEVLSVEDALDADLRPARFHATVVDGFALFVLVITCLGIFASVSYAVSRRQREIAVKLALGARATEVIVDVVGQSVRTVGVGLLAGAVGSLSIGRMMRAVLYGTSPYDPLVYGAVLLLLAFAAAVAAYIPARRAVGIDPALLMRAE